MENNLKKLRTKTGLSQRQLSLLSGVHTNIISRLECDKQDINRTDLQTVVKLARAMSIGRKKVRVEDLYEEDRSDNQKTPGG